MLFRKNIKKIPKFVSLVVGGVSFSYLGWKFYDIQALSQPDSEKDTQQNQLEINKQVEQTPQINEKQEFVNELLKSINKDVNQNLKDQNLVQQFNDQIQQKEALLILTFSLLGEYQKIIEFIKNFKKQNLDTNLYIAFVENLKDIKEIEEKTKRKVLSKDQKLNFFSYYNDIFDEIQYLTPSTIYNFKIFERLKKPSYITDDQQLQDFIQNMNSDEMLFIFSEKNMEMKKMVFGNNYVNFDKVKILFNNDIPQNEYQIYTKFKKQEIPVQQIKDQVQKNHNETLQNINKKINNQIGFDQNFFNYKDEKVQYLVSFKIDKNIVPKVLREYIDTNIKKVKERLGNESEKFKFIQINSKHHNSEKNWIQVKGVDLQKYEQKVYYKYQNNDKQELEKYLKDNRDEWEAQSLYYVPKLQQYSEDEIFEFCKSILDGSAEYDTYSQKPFQKDFYSNKITANSFQQKIIDNDQDQALFIHSNHCHGCKKFLPVYEKLALQNLQEKQLNLTFNRINNDYNHNNDQPYHWTTPKIQIYRSGHKSIPYEYRHAYLNEKLLQDFLSITTKFSIIDWNLLDNIQSLEKYNFQIILQLNLCLINGKQTIIVKASMQYKKLSK